MTSLKVKTNLEEKTDFQDACSGDTQLLFARHLWTLPSIASTGPTLANQKDMNYCSTS